MDTARLAPCAHTKAFMFVQQYLNTHLTNVFAAGVGLTRDTHSNCMCVLAVAFLVFPIFIMWHCAHTSTVVKDMLEELNA